jgi:ATP-dependent Zn protease
MKKNNLVKNFFIFFLVFLFIASFLSLYSAEKDTPEEISLNQLVSYINEDKVSGLDINNEKLTIKLTDGSEKISQKEVGEPLTATLRNLGVARKNYKRSI